MTTELMWFRRDLRVHDNPALRAAARAEVMVAVFVCDPHLLTHERMSPARIVYLRHALADLSGVLTDRGGRLVVRVGDPAEVVPALAEQVGARTVHCSADHSPFARRRDEAVAAALADAGRQLRAHGGVAIAEPGSVRTGGGGVYKVFTPFHRSWREVDHGDPLDPPPSLPPGPDLAGEPISEIGLLHADAPEEPWPDGGETAARARMEGWLAEGVDDYDERRDLLAVPGTSRLSPDLHFGCLSARELWSRLDRRNPGQQAFATEIAWRDFYLHVLAEWPHAARSAWRRQNTDLAWRDDEEGFRAWAEGRTGFPVVDAAMRQLATMGWMHNRARMIVASFLCKDLLIDWRWGEAHFMANLVDGDTASNNGGWQWAAGTGTDAQPFFRIFNPVTQGERFDPDGDYVRRFVPELAGMPAPAIHQPWTLEADELAQYGVRLGEDYPWPLVDHAEARERALAWWNDA